MSRAPVDSEQLLAMVAHDMRAPLRQLGLRLAMLQRRHAQSLGPEALAELQAAREELKQGQQLLEDMLAWAAGSPAETPAACALGALGERAWASLAERVEQRGARLTLDPALSAVQARPSAVYRLLLNLLRNALEHGGDGVQVRVEAVGGGRSGFAVVDNGPGIAPARQARIFAPFARGDVARGVEGSGLGLAICERLAGEEGGHIRLDAEHQGGARFIVELPAA